jgi:hypothetical protein
MLFTDLSITDPLLDHHVKSCDQRAKSANTLAAILAGKGT